MEGFVKLDRSNISTEHICCAISDKKCREGYEAKKAWLRREFDNGYVFRRLKARAKVFIEYGPAETGWAPVTAPNHLLINCFWVAGQYKGKGYGKELLRLALEDAQQQGKDGLVTVVGTRKFHFMSDTNWLLRQGFTCCEELPYGFSLLVKTITPTAQTPRFSQCAKTGACPPSEGLTAYYSDRCPFAEYHVTVTLAQSSAKRGVPLTTIKLDTLEKAQSAPSPATIFSLFARGKFVTTDLSACTEGKFDKIVSPCLGT